MLKAPTTLNAWTLFTRSLRVTGGTLLNTLGLLLLFVGLPLAILGGLAALSSAIDALPGWTVAIATFVPMAVMVLALPTLWGGISYSAFQYLRGRPATLPECLRAALPRSLHLLITALLLAIFFGLGYMVCIIPGIVVWVGLYLAIPLTVVEKALPSDAISRSWRLTHGYRLSLFLFLCLLQVLNYALIVPISLVPEEQEILLGILALAWLPILALTTMVSMVSYGVAYFDLRHLQDGDLAEDLVEVFE